jgi:hypothetical protein
LASSWKIRAVTTEDAESGTGYWQPFAVGHDIMGQEVILVRQFSEDEGEKSSAKGDREQAT